MRISKLVAGYSEVNNRPQCFLEMKVIAFSQDEDKIDKLKKDIVKLVDKADEVGKDAKPTP